MEKIPLKRLQEFVQKVLQKLPAQKNSATVLALSGDLGAGKTTFVQALAKELGVEKIVQSPTYVLMKSYEIPNQGQGDTLKSFGVKVSPFSRLVHADLYRLEKPEEFSTLRPEEFLNNSRNLVCIEWPERADNLLPKPELTIKFSSDGASEGERYIEVI